MDETSDHRLQRFFLGGGRLDPRAHPVVLGGVVGLIAVWMLVGIRDAADFEALQWWVYVNYDFTPRVNPFTIGPFLAGITGGYTAGYLTTGLYERSVANAVKANLLAGLLYYVTTVFSTIGSFLRAGVLSVDAVLIATIQPLIFLAIPFTFVFMCEGVLVGPFGQYVRRKLLNESPRPHVESEPLDTASIVRASVVSGVIAITITAGTWVFLYSIYLFVTP